MLTKSRQVLELKIREKIKLKLSDINHESHPAVNTNKMFSNWKISAKLINFY